MEFEDVPGFRFDQQTLRRRGLVGVAVILLIGLAVYGYQTIKPTHQSALTLLSPSVAAGIVPGSPVKSLGIQIGTVDSVESLGGGRQAVRLSVEETRLPRLTDDVGVDYSAGNLFGVTEVELTPHSGGSPLRDGAMITPRVTDNSVANMITTLGDINSDAIRPHAGAILENVDATTQSLMSWLTTIGSLAQQVHDTQKLPTSKTFPQVTATLTAAGAGTKAILSAVEDQAAITWTRDKTRTDLVYRTEHSITDRQDGVIAAAERILNPRSVAGLRDASPALTALLDPVLKMFPNGAGSAGISIHQLIENIRAAMPNVGAGPVLNVSVRFDQPDTRSQGLPIAGARPQAQPGR
ncbi:MlaD family protein [Tsukamurella sp. 8F]|uniref:MlaD family protein n=1 Tax=unclassified Tsukamurella TaxID=2633480 RepID=UPI0023B9FF29|nr:MULTISPECIES: MlaD family protein [unclassified Tsukamurella]MDF0530616.1 MlaD family protein [Tsukamurella sp. 8J]MDF0587817.1 MlaD family protein [Tsukamurella sp. 8F]